MATPVSESIGLTGNPFIDGLTQGGAWQAADHQLTYSFSINDTIGNQPSWTPALKQAVVNALGVWSSVANLSFVEVGSGTVFTQSLADLAITLTGSELQANSDTVGIGLFPSPAYVDQVLEGIGYTRASYPRPEGDVFLAYQGRPPGFNAGEAVEV